MAQASEFKFDASRLRKPINQMTDLEARSILKIQLRSDPAAERRYRDYLAGWSDSMRTFESSSFRGFERGERRRAG